MWQADLSAFNKFVTNVAEWFEKDARRQAAPEIIGWIKARAAIGKSYSGSQFKPYTEKYAARRKKFDLQTGFRDLRFSGEMLDGLHFDSTQNAIVPDTGTEGRTEGQNFGVPSKNVPPSPFLGITKEEGEITGKRLSENMVKYVTENL